MTAETSSAPAGLVELRAVWERLRVQRVESARAARVACGAGERAIARARLVRDAERAAWERYVCAVRAARGGLTGD